MSDATSFAELDGQHTELLPARTVLSLLSLAGPGGTPGTPGAPGTGAPGPGMWLPLGDNQYSAVNSGSLGSSRSG